MLRKLTVFLLAVSLMVGVGSGVGCVKKPVSPAVPEAPSVTYERNLLAAADAVDVVAAGLQTVDQARKTLLTNQQITPEESDKILSWLKAVAAKNQAAVEAIRLAQVAGNSETINWKQNLVDVSMALNAVDPALFGIKNPNAVTTLKISLATLAVAAQSIQTFSTN